MRIPTTLALTALGTLSLAQVKFDDITMRMMSPQWGTVLVGAQGYFNDACQFTVGNYQDWQRVWPSVAGPHYRPGMDVPQFIDWNTEQIVIVSLGNLGMQGYGLYVEDVRRSTSFQFDIRYVITRPGFQAGVSYSQSGYGSVGNLNFGLGTTPFIVLRVPRYYGIPNFYSRYYQPPSYVVRSGCGCGHCHTHNQVWMLGAGGVLIPYVPPGQQQAQGGGI